MSEEPRIEVTKDGPYAVTGGLPLRPKERVLSEHGESMTWRTGEAAPAEDEYYLCRCGQSSNKPYCDGSHLRLGFDGTENAPTSAWEERIRKFDGTGIEVLRDKLLCVHAAFCANRLTDWYQMLAETDDSVARTHLIGMIERCPSGSLSYAIDDEVIEPDLPVEIAPVADGPLWVTGGVTIVRSDGEPFEARHRVTLCRCGHSSTKPLCDGTHVDIGFEA